MYFKMANIMVEELYLYLKRFKNTIKAMTIIIDMRI